MQRHLLIREEVRENSRDFSEDLRAVLHGGRREGQVTEANLYSRPQCTLPMRTHSLILSVLQGMCYYAAVLISEIVPPAHTPTQQVKTIKFIPTGSDLGG